METLEKTASAVKDAMTMLEKMKASRLLFITAFGMALLLCWNVDGLAEFVRAMGGR